MTELIKNKKGQAEIAGAVVVLIIVLGITVALLGVDGVEPNHLGVKVKFGKILGTMKPGVEWTGMFTHVYEYDMRIRKVSVNMLDEKSSATDKDGQAIFGSISVNFRLKMGDTNVVQELYKNVGYDNIIADRLNIVPIIKEGFKQAIVQYEAIEILQKRQEVKEQAIKNIQANFPEDYFEIVDIVVEDLDFSVNFKAAIEAKKTATQEKLKEEEMVKVVMFQQQQEIERYKAQAEQLRLQKSQVTALLNQQKWIEAWDGHLPDTIMTSGPNVEWLMQLPTAGNTAARAAIE